MKHGKEKNSKMSVIIGCGRYMSDEKFWKRRIERLAGKKQEIRNLYDKVKIAVYTKGPWAFKKLLVVDYYIDIFTNIAKCHFKNVVYFDLLAGCGFTRIDDYDEIVAGSALLSMISPRTLKSGERRSFDSIVLVEKDLKKCASLEKILPNSDVICEDCNSIMVKNEIEEKMKADDSIYLAFVDPERIEIHWSTLETLFNCHGDLMINYQYSGVARAVGKFHTTHGKAKQGYHRRIQHYFGNDKWSSIPYPLPEGELAERLYNLYKSQLVTYRPRIVAFPIIGNPGFQYRILIAAKETGGGSPWLHAMEKLREKVDKMSSEQLATFIEIYRGKGQKSLSEFF